MSGNTVTDNGVKRLLVNLDSSGCNLEILRQDYKKIAPEIICMSKLETEISVSYFMQVRELWCHR